MAFSAVLTGTARSCTLTSGQPTMTVSSNTGLVVGATIQGTGITAGTKITAISGTTITMSANATAGGAQNLIFSSVYGSTLTITLSASGDVATWQNVFNAGFGLLQGSKSLLHPGALTVTFGSIVAGARFDHQDWTVEYGTGGRQLFDSGLLAGEQRGGYDIAGSLLVKAAGPTFIFNFWNNGGAGGSNMFINTGSLLTQGGTFRMHDARFVQRTGNNSAFAFMSVRDFMIVENLVLDYLDGTGANASIGCGYGEILNPKIIGANSGLNNTNSTATGKVTGLYYLGLFGDTPNAKFSIPNGFTMDGYAPQVTSAQTIGGFSSNTTETYSNIDLTSPGWGLTDLKTKYFRYGGTNVINFPRRVSFEFNDSVGANLTGVTLYIKSGSTSIVNAVQAGDYSANTQALILNWTTTTSAYRVRDNEVDTIAQVAQVRKYGYIEQSTSYSLNTSAYSQPFFMLTDSALVGISEATAAAITAAGINWSTKTITPTADLTYDQINARIAYELAQTANSAQADPRTVVGSNLTLATGWTLVVNTGRTISTGTAITYLYCPTVTLNGTGKITAVYATTAGTSTSFEARNVKNGAAYIIALNADKSTVLYGTNSTGTAQNYKVFFPPGSAGTEIYVARKFYGDFIDAEVIELVEGEMYYSFIDIADEGIKQTDKTVVAAYTQLETNTKVYEYSALYQTTEAGIKLGKFLTRAGPFLNWAAPYSALIKQDAAALWSKSGNLFTIKADGLAADANYTTNVLVPPATMTADTNEVMGTEIIDANGDSSLTIQGGSGSYEIWKVANGTPEDQYATGTLLADNVGLGKWRFTGTTGYYILVRDKAKNNRDTCSMEKGTYVIGLYAGKEQITVAQLPEVYEIQDSLALMQIDIDNMPTSVWAKAIETGYSALATMRLMASVLVGKVSGAGTGTETFRDLNDTKDRVISSVDSQGNRTEVTKDGS